MKKFLDQSSWRTALGNLLPSAHGHQGGSRKAAIGSMLIMAFAFVGCDDSSSASVENSEPAALSSAEKQGSSSLGSVSSAGSEASSSSRCAGASEECDEAISSDSDAESNGSSLSSSSEKLSVISSSSAGKAKFSSSVVTLANPCKTETEDNCEYGELTDDRDGQTYKTVKIGDQWWMAENLNYETDNSFCYNDSAEYCEKYGRLYTWAAATDSAGVWGENGKGCGYAKHCTTAYPVRGVCPEGWHLPTKNEWNTLSTAVGGQTTPGKVLKSTSGWYTDDVYHGNGTDAFSFSALPAGYRIYTGHYDLAGYYAYFWSSTARDSRNAYNVYLYYNHDYMALDYSDKRRGFSVRCVKD